MKVSVQDVNGFFVPNLRRNNFAVFDDGVPQRNVTVDVEHAPLTIAVLVEMGGRSQQLNEALARDVVFVARPLLDVLGREDKLAVFTYDDALHTVVDFGDSHDKWEPTFSDLKTPQFSESNFYDAAMQVLDRLGGMPGRKAMLVLSTGIDTFSRATFDDLVKKAEQAKTPIYAVGLAEVVQHSIVDVTQGPLARVNWGQLDQQLEALSRASGGRLYLHASTFSVPAIYDDIMENLRIRYVIMYVPSPPATSGVARTVQVRLVNPSTGQPLQIADSNGRRVSPRVIAQASYTPSTVTPRISG